MGEDLLFRLLISSIGIIFILFGWLTAYRAHRALLDGPRINARVGGTQGLPFATVPTYYLRLDLDDGRRIASGTMPGGTELEIGDRVEVLPHSSELYLEAHVRAVRYVGLAWLVAGLAVLVLAALFK